MFLNQAHQVKWMNKMLAVLLIIALTFTNFLVVGNTLVSYAVESNLDTQNEKTMNKNIEFDTYFLKDNEKTHYLIYDVNGENAKLYMNLTVKEGYLKDATIQMNQNNYQIEKIEDESGMVQSSKDQTITLKQLEANTEHQLVASIQANLTEKMAQTDLQKTSQVTLKGTYVDKSGRENPFEKTVQVNVKFMGTSKVTIEQEPVTYTTFQENGVRKWMVREKVSVGLENKQLPIQESQLKVTVPTIQGVKPEKVQAIVQSAELTNGTTVENMTQKENNVQYDSQSQSVSITVENKEKEGNIWNGKGTDTYWIDCVYPIDAFAENATHTWQTKAQVNMQMYTGETITGENQQNFTFSKTFGSMLSLQVQAHENELSKGKLYANVERDKKEYETIYHTKWQIDITNPTNLKGITIKESGDNFIDNNGVVYPSTIENKNYIYDKALSISQINFEEILGEKGEITIENEQGNTLATINSQTKIQDGQYKVDSFDTTTGKLVIKTTQPVAEGNLCFTVEKRIAADLPYRKEQIKTFQQIKSSAMLVENKTEKEEQTADKTAEIRLAETNTNAEISINRDTLSTIVNNENVELKIALDNAREETDLYANPVFKIELPEYIEDVQVKDANILYDDQLKIADIQKQKENGKTVLQIRLSGMQNGFSTGSISKGTNILLNTDMKAKILTPNKEDSIQMYYYNPNAVQYANTTNAENQTLGETSTPVAFSAPAGMVAISQMSQYESTGKSIMSVAQGSVTDKIGVYDTAKTAKMNVTFMNNTGDVCNHITAIGRIPFQGNRTVFGNRDLGTTVSTTLKSKLTAQGIAENQVQIYYSENGEATQDLKNQQNAWTQNPSDWSKIKSYMIVCGSYEMQPGSSISFAYDFEIPANLEHGNQIYGAFGVAYTEKSELGEQTFTAEADPVGLTTGEGPKLKIDQNISVGEGQPIQEGQMVKYTVSITNTGKEEVKNVQARDYIPTFLKYAEYQEGSGNYGEVQSGYIYPETQQENGQSYITWNIDRLGIGETVQKEYEAVVQKLPSIINYYENHLEGFGKVPGYSLVYDDAKDSYQLYQVDENSKITASQEVKEVPGSTAVNKVVLTAQDLEKSLTSENTGNPIEKAYFNLQENASVDKNSLLAEKQEMTYTIDIQNTSNQTQNNVVAEKMLPDGTIYEKANIQNYNESTGNWEDGTPAQYDQASGKITWNLGTMQAQETKRVEVSVTMAPLAEGETEKEIRTTTSVIADGVNKHVSAETINTVAKPNIETNISSDDSKEYLAEGDRITYTIQVSNTGKLSANSIKIQDALPEELKFVSGSYNVNNGQEGSLNEYNNQIEMTTNLLAGETICLTIVAEAKDLPNDVDEKEITNYATITGENIQDIKTEEIKNIIEQANNRPNPPASNGETGNTGNPNNTNKSYKIRGTVWVDANNNGARDTDETLLSGVTVRLMNADNGQFVKDDQQNELRIQTGEDGSYVWDNLVTGNYIVVFDYDTNVYDLTEYKKNGVNEQQNSDVITNNIKENNALKTVAVTDTIRLTDSSYANVDMGLVYRNKFDLKLDKSVTKITVQNKEGSKAYEYNDSKLAKVDITGKRLAGTTVIVEYSLKVTNEGNIAGYAKNVVDYLPSDFKFSSDLNPNWYQGNNGYVYSNELASQVLNPGETKEVKLVLTKTMTETNTGVSNNRAEIAEDYNDYGMKDIDSTPGNGAQGEDDLGTADVIISVKTGGAVLYTCIILIALLLAAAGLTVLKKKTARYYN